MESLDAQALLVELTTEGECAPAHWRHDRDGSLTCHFPGSEREFTWPPAAVADIAARWRAEGRDPPRSLERIASAHQAFIAMLTGAELDLPDAVVHDLDAREVRARWNDQKLEVIVEAFDRSGKEHHDARARAS